MSRNTFDDGSVGRIARAVRAIERLGGDRAEPPVDYETDASATFRQVIRGTFSGVWAKGATAEVTFTADNGDTATKTATNYCYKAGADSGESACVIALTGGEWVLVEAVEWSADTTDPASCEQLTLVTVDPAGSVEVVTDVSSNLTGGGVTYVSCVACVGGNLVVTTSTLDITNTLALTKASLSLSDFATLSNSTINYISCNAST